jgi:hypothetical protein
MYMLPSFLGVLSEPFEAISRAIRVAELIGVLRLVIIVSIMAPLLNLRAQAGWDEFPSRSQKRQDLYRLWRCLYYIWPRRAPHRPTRPGFSAGVLRALLLGGLIPCLTEMAHYWS